MIKLHPISFNWNNQNQEWKKQHQIGLIAQEVEPVVPEAVSTAHDAMKTKGLAYGSLVPVLIKAIQELNSLVTEQKEALAKQQDEIDGLKQTVEWLTQQK